MRKNEEFKIGQLLGGVYKQLHITEDVVQHRVKAVWDELFGARFANYVRKFTFIDGVLTIYITSDALRQELFMNRSKIKDRMNENLGQALINQVLLK